MFSRMLTTLAVSVLTLTAMACAKGSHDAETGADESTTEAPPPPCTDCSCCDPDEGKLLGVCTCFLDNDDPQVLGGPSCVSVAFLEFKGDQCGMDCGNVLEWVGHVTGWSWGPPGDAPCPASGAHSCAQWSPASNVTFSSGVYHVDSSLLISLIAAPWPLWECDDATVDGLSAGGFQINGASSGELLYTLGLRTGDKPLALNGLPLDDYTDGFQAFEQLWVGQAETDYLLTVKRGTTTLTLQYEVVP